MSSSHVHAIRRSIDNARHAETLTPRLKHCLVPRIAHLHRSLEAERGALVEFVTHYIEHVPDFVDTFVGLTKNAGIDDIIVPVVTTIEALFKNSQIPEDLGMFALLDEAYFAHRVIEETSDHITAALGTTLAPVDMTVANLVVHQLLGEKFANDLDRAALFCIESLLSRSALADNPAFADFASGHRRDFWPRNPSKWPCLASTFAISLNLPERDRSVLH